MNPILTNLKTYFESAYLSFALWLAVGYVVTYLIALVLAKFGGADRTIIYHCRRAWAVALLIHVLFVIGVTIRWFVMYGYFPSFWGYFPWYLGMIIFDFFVILLSIRSIDRYSSYQQ